MIVDVDTLQRSISVRKPDASGEVKSFNFDATYGTDSTQMQLYEESARPIVDAALEGYNGTIFAYGQTGTGKSFTMEGNLGDPVLFGVIPNSFHQIFRHIEDSSNLQFLVRASYLEIYNEEIRDLLSATYTRKLKLRESPETGVFVQDLSAFVVASASEIDAVMRAGKKHRVVGSTDMNDESSRSHSVFTITIECSQTGLDGEQHVRVGKLNLVDLAGSERAEKTNAQGARLKEGININQSLTNLGTVIKVLAQGDGAHVPYRNSQLTRLLQDSLGGNSKTVMIANIGPADYNYDETVSTLRWADRAKNIKNKPKINEDPKDAMLRQFQDEIERLKAQLAAAGGGADGGEQPVEVTMADGSVVRAANSEEAMAAMQRDLDAEREALAANKNMLESERARLTAELDARAESVARERAEQDALRAKLQAMQDKVLHSGTEGLIGLKEKQERQLEENRLKLERQAREEERLRRELEAQREEAEVNKKSFQSAEEQAAAMTKRLKKLWSKLQAAKNEINDITEEHGAERGLLNEEVRRQANDIKLARAIIAHFIPQEEVRKVQARAVWSDEMDDFVLAPADAAFDRKLPRPVAHPGERRPTPDSVLNAIAQGATNPRYKVENVLSLELVLPKRTTMDFVGSGAPPGVQAALEAALQEEERELSLHAVESLPGLAAKPPQQQQQAAPKRRR